MAQNDPNYPEKARIAQDVEEAPKARGSGDFHAGRGVCLCSTIEGRGAVATTQWRVCLLRKGVGGLSLQLGWSFGFYMARGTMESFPDTQHTMLGEDP